MMQITQKYCYRLGVFLVALTVVLAAPSCMAGVEVGAAQPVPVFKKRLGLKRSTPHRLSVLDFGADPTGKLDSRSAINATIKKLSQQGGGVCYIPAGTYKLSLPRGKSPHIMIRLPSYITIVGEGWQTILDATAIPEDASKGSGIIVSGAEETVDVQIKNLCIQGGGFDFHFARPSVPGIFLKNVSRFEISGVRLNNIVGISIVYVNARYGLIRDNYIYGGLRDGCTGFGTIKNVSIIGNHIEKVEDDAIAINYMMHDPNTNDPDYCPSGIVIANNIINHTTSRGINLMHLRYSVVAKNTIIGARTAGIRLAPDHRPRIIPQTMRSDSVVISGNIIRNVYRGRIPFDPYLSQAGAGDGIHISEADHIVISDNIISGIRRNGISLDDTTQAMIRGNQIGEVDYYGIWERSNRGLRLSDNIFFKIQKADTYNAKPNESYVLCPPASEFNEPDWSDLFPGIKSAPVDLRSRFAAGMPRKLSAATFYSATYVKVKGNLKIDGQLDKSEWSRVPGIWLLKPVLLNGNGVDLAAESTRARGRFQWDETGFYFAIEVADRIHFQEGKKGVVWEGDSLQMSFDPLNDRALKHYAADDYEYTFFLDSEGSKSLIVFSPDDSPNKISLNTMVVIHHNNSAGWTVYEGRLAWSDIAPVNAEKGTRFGMSFLINNNDGVGRTGWLEWTQGIGKGKDPSRFAEIILVK